jgi:CDP-alcohol phosphatidyltransferase
MTAKDRGSRAITLGFSPRNAAPTRSRFQSVMGKTLWVKAGLLVLGFRQWVPNAISLARIVIALVMAWCADSPWWAVGLLAVCAATDAADGFLARRWGVTSEAGARIDSVADLLFFYTLATKPVGPG